MNRIKILNSLPFIVITAVCLLVAIALLFFLVVPKYRGLTALQTKIKEKELELQYTKGYLEKLNKTKAELENYKTELAKISSTLPTDPNIDIPTLYNFLQRAASQAGLVLKEIGAFSFSAPDTASAENVPEIKTIQTNLTVTGSYASMKNLLSILERSARMIEVENISFSSSKEELFTFKLSLKAHLY